MRIKITGVAEGKAIEAIKGLRSLEGSSLKVAKEAIERVRMGTPYELETNDLGIELLRRHYCMISPMPKSSGSDLISALKDFPAGIRVGDLIAVLEAMEKRS